MTPEPSPDAETASAFSESWNHLEPGSVYTRSQFLEWFDPIDPASVRGGSVLELGFGNGSLLYHMAHYAPSRLCGVELGDTHETTRRNLDALDVDVVAELHQGDLTQVALGEFDLVYCIGVLHHLKSPHDGFDAVLRHTRPGGRFHCWVYAHEGNGVVRLVVEPMRRIASRLPWWLTKYAVALPAVIPYFIYAKLLRALVPRSLGRALPLFDYSLWIAERGFGFFHHVAFDQLVTPTTSYLREETVASWLEDERVDPSSRYVIFRNGNSWKFGGRRVG